MKDTIDKLINDAKLFYCVECGKCVAGCPMTQLYDDFSYAFTSRGVIRKAVLTGSLIDSKDIWRCLSCHLCEDMCPAGVKYAQFIANIRLLAIDEGYTESCSFCEKCGKYYLPLPTVTAYKDKFSGNDRPDEYTNFCPTCKLDSCAEGIKIGAFRVGRKLSSK